MFPSERTLPTSTATVDEGVPIARFLIVQPIDVLSAVVIADLLDAGLVAAAC